MDAVISFVSFFNNSDSAQNGVNRHENKRMILNLGTGNKTTLNEMGELFMVITRVKKEVDHIPRNNSATLMRRLVNAERAKRELNFEANFELRKGFVDLIHWRRSHIGKLVT